MNKPLKLVSGRTFSRGAVVKIALKTMVNQPQSASKYASGFLGGVVCLLFFACSPFSEPSPTVTLFAAASTTNAVAEITERFQHESDIAVKTNLASSGALAQQILAGAEADIFLSANQMWVDALQEKNFVSKKQTLLSNRLVIAIPAKSQIEINGPKALTQDPIARIAIADPLSVPAGIYAKKALTALGLWETVHPKTVRGADVRQTLVYVETGEAQAGLIYATDAALSNRVRVVYEFDWKQTGRILYPLVLTRYGEENPAAHQLYHYFASPEAAAVFFEKHSFIPPGAEG